MEKKKKVTPYDLHGPVDLKLAIPLGLQHVLAMFVGNLTPLIVIAGACGITATSGDPEMASLQIVLFQNAMLVAGIVTLVQVAGLGPCGSRMPIVMGTSAGFIGVCSSAAAACGGGLIGYGAVLGASLIGGFFEGAMGVCLKKLRKFFPCTVTGISVLTIGLSLVPVGIRYFGGGNANKDYGSAENLLLGLAVLIIIIALKHFTKGFTSVSAILIGIICGYIIATIMGFVLPHTYTYTETVDGVEVVREATKSWVINWSAIGEASWFSVPKLFPVKLVFDIRAILPIAIMFIVTTIQTIGDISGVAAGGLNREATDSELSGGIICDGLGSSFAALFGVLPNTSFGQNVGLVTMNKVVNCFTIGTGAIFLIICGLLPKVSAIISIMPQSVLGGAAVMMFASICVSGINLITSRKLTTRSITVVAVALGLGYGLGNDASVLQFMPEGVQLIFGGSGVVPACVIAIILNIILPKGKDDYELEEQEKAAALKKEAAN